MEVKPAAGVTAAAIETDAVIIGAGPVGLFQVFQLGLQEIRAHVIDALPHAGGQCVELYADKPIYDIPGLPVCTGRELVERLQRQIEPFVATFHFNQEVGELQRRSDGRFDLSTSAGTRFTAKTVFIAAGVGAFVPRKLKLDGIERFENRQLFYRMDDPASFAGKDVMVLGGEEEAVRGVLQLCEDGPHKPRSVTLLHRRDVYRAPPEELARLRELADCGALRLLVGQPTGYREDSGELKALEVTDVDDAVHTHAVDAVLVLQGLSPKLGPVANWGLALERKQVKVDTESFSTEVPGIFAVGDINTYPGKKKLILCGFHECVLAAFGAVPIIDPDRKVMLQYTTTSPRLHKLLGVDSPQVD
jgi:thioredoxin reductase (NADPH)